MEREIEYGRDGKRKEEVEGEREGRREGGESDMRGRHCGSTLLTSGDDRVIVVAMIGQHGQSQQHSVTERAPIIACVKLSWHLSFDLSLPIKSLFFVNHLCPNSPPPPLLSGRQNRA